jgi:hypothetical protein
MSSMLFGPFCGSIGSRRHSSSHPLDLSNNVSKIWSRSFGSIPEGRVFYQHKPRHMVLHFGFQALQIGRFDLLAYLLVANDGRWPENQSTDREK